MTKSLAVTESPLSSESLISAAILSLPSPLSRRAYASRLRVFLAWISADESHAPPFNRLTVETYIAYMRDNYSVSACNQSLAAIKRLAQTATDHGTLDDSICARIQSVKGRGNRASKVGNWLTKEQGQQLIAYDYSKVKSIKTEQRDRVLITFLLGCGLRRAEACRVKWPQIQYRDGRQVIMDLTGKGGVVRTIPIPKWANELIREWRAHFQPIDEGYVLRAVHSSGSIGKNKLSESAAWEIVKERGKSIGLDDIAPHDLRRTFAKLSRKGGAKIEQIQIALGHASVMTTERYLGTAMEIGEAACDRTGL